MRIKLLDFIMTSIIAWLNKEEESEKLWVVSDSKVSGTSNMAMLSGCPKLYAIPIKLQLTQKMNYQFQVASIGYGYCGSTLLGQSCLIKLSSILGNLAPMDSKDIGDINEAVKKLPSMDEISTCARDVLNELVEEMAEYMFLKQPRSPLASQIIIFGFCNKDKKYKSYKIGTTPDCQVSANIFEHDLYSSDYLVMGDKTDLVLKDIITEKEGFEAGSINWHRSPMHALKKIIREKKYESIGGPVQLVRSVGLFSDVIFPFTHGKMTIQSMGGYFPHPKYMNMDKI